MASTKIQIVNQALTSFGHRRLASLDAENETARVVKEVYAATLDFVLEAVDPSFARRSSGALSLLAEVDSNGVQPVQGYDFLYSMPNDCIRIRSVFPDGAAHVSAQDKAQKQNFEEMAHPTTGARCIATDVEDAYSYFTSRVLDTSQYTPAFVKTLVAMLASEIVLPLTQKETLAQTMYQKAMVMLPEAARLSARRENPKTRTSGGYIDAR